MIHPIYPLSPGRSFRSGFSDWERLYATNHHRDASLATGGGLGSEDSASLTKLDENSAHNLRILAPNVRRTAAD